MKTNMIVAIYWALYLFGIAYWNRTKLMKLRYGDSRIIILSGVNVVQVFTIMAFMDMGLILFLTIIKIYGKIKRFFLIRKINRIKKKLHLKNDIIFSSLSQEQKAWIKAMRNNPRPVYTSPKFMQWDGKKLTETKTPTQVTIIINKKKEE